MTRYTFTQAAELLGVDPKTARAWLEGVPWETREYGQAAHLYTREQLEEVARAHARTLTDETTPIAEASGARPTLAELAHRVEALEQALAELRATRAPVARGTPIRVTPSPESQINATYKQPLIYSADLPDSKRGRAEWVQLHGGPGASWVREWAEISTWRTVEDAIASVRRRARGFENWTPTGWTPEAPEE